MTAFTQRRGTHTFREPTQTNNWTSLVNGWHQNVYRGLPVEYIRAQTAGTPDHNPEWVVTPKIMGELNPDYRASGPTFKDAMEESARRIAASRHC
ncbi:hypothetical protein RSOLAG22IIIB_09401 [Rhizoctonia solani]|uniref:Uncharacterized protein n=1 Tax=Rhizoctonia solani TaxID=456999 RepID=A0A0K6FY24_9AGAM|nr:hypothetical protein RSOLAG22IIIB_09401 [Rhizoctonia solani]